MLMTRRVFFVAISLVLLFTMQDTNVFAQAKREVKGIVLDKVEQMPLIGASVVALKPNSDEVNASFGTITDLDGRFVISVPAETQRITVQYLGYKSEFVEIMGVDFVDIRLEAETQALDAVVVTGYGKIDRRKNTASVSKISMQEAPQVAMSVDQMLQGQMAGVSVASISGAPGAPAKIRIRGTSSLNGTQDPLWVLDGMPLEGTDLPDLSDSNIDQLYSSAIAGINPADIESITVLKDAAATAIYGARAANGVIVITTKKGKKGSIRVNYSGKTSIVAKPDISRLNLLSSSQKVDLELALLRSDFDYLKDKGGVSRILSGLGETNSYIAGGWDALSADAQSQINALKRMNTDWNDLLFRSSVSQDHYISISGGNDEASYFLSTGFYDEKGTTIGVGSTRYNITAKTDYKFSERLTIGASLFANQRENTSYLTLTDGFTNPVFYSRRANPYLTVRDTDGGYVYDLDMQGYGKGGNIPFNIFEERSNTSNNMKVKSMNAIFDLSYRIIPALVLDVQYGVQYDVTNTQAFSGEDSYSTRKEIEKSRLITGPFIPTGGIIKNTDATSFQYTLKNMLRYSKLVGDYHEFEVMVGNELRRSTDESVFSAAYGYDPNTLTSKPVIYPDESYAVQFPLFRRNYYENAFVSFFGTGSYTFKRRYTFGSSIRYDGSNIFGVDPKYRYLPLYSVSGLWRASEEAFLKDVSWLSDLRFRASYGLQGNIDKSTSPKLVGEWKPDVTILPGVNEPNITVSSPPNERLRWERTATYNVGFDLAVVNNRYKISADYYQRESTDLIGMKQLPLETGFAYTTINWSSLTNKGVELNLSALLVKTDKLSWDMQVNFSYNYNRVNRVTVRSDQRTPVTESYPVGAIFTLPYAGLDQYGYPLIYNANGEAVLLTDLLQLRQGIGGSIERGLSALDERSLYNYSGTDEAPYSGGFTNIIRYKNWDFYASVVSNFGHNYLVQPYYSLTGYDRGLNVSSEILNRWTDENPNGYLPRLITEGSLGGTRVTEYGGYSDFAYDKYFSLWLRDAGYIRLQSVRIGYAVPEKFAKKLRLQNLKVNVEAKNLFVYGFDYKGFLDPETMKNPFAQPIPRSVTLSVNLGF